MIISFNINSYGIWITLTCYIIIWNLPFFRLEGNPLCSNNNTIVQLCGSESDNEVNGNTNVTCPGLVCLPPFEYSTDCSCAAPLLVDYRLKSPGFSYFLTYEKEFESFLTNGLNIQIDQLSIDSFTWEGPRLKMNLKFFPEHVDNTSTQVFNQSEVNRITNLFREWDIHIQDNDLFGPYELLDFNLLDIYKDGKSQTLFIIC